MAQRTPIYTPKGQFLPLIQRPDNKQNREDGVLLPLALSTDTTVTRDLLIVIDGIGSPFATGIHGDVRIDFATVIVGWTVLADQSGSVQLDVWKDVYGNYPPTVLDTITGSSPPKLVSTDHNTSTSLPGWKTGVTPGDCLRFHVDSVATVTRITLALHLEG